MSRIGKLPVAIPAGVDVKLEAGNVITVKGPKGTLTRKLADDMNIAIEDGHVVVTRPNDLKRNKSLHGLTRTLINNMIIGVTQGYEKVLEINGVGYRVAKSGKKLTLTLGYSHPVEMTDPEGMQLKSEQNVPLNLIKEKVLSMLMSISDVKLVKQVRNNKGVRSV